jgi:hypothetical protein
MDRREHLRLLISGSFGAGFFLNEASEISQKDIETSEKIIRENGGGYGRTDAEVQRDKRLHAESFFTEHELKTVAVLADIIIPADDVSGSATDAGVPEFMEFIMKDMPYMQTPARGGIMWLDNESKKRFGKVFINASKKQQLQIVDDIAYPDDAKPEMEYGVRFFNRMRNLTSTGFFTSEIGIKDMGYKGNQANAWDGVPENVLKKHGMSYEKKILEECVRDSERGIVAKWDDDMNLIRE